MNKVQARCGWLAAACAGMALTALPARADVLDFSYTLSATNTVISGTLDGTLQADSNVFDVTDLASFSVGGTAITEATTVQSTDAVFSPWGNAVAAVSLDGTYLNLFIQGVTSGSQAGFAVGDASSASLGYAAADATAGYGGNYSNGSPFAHYVAANWTASLEAVPEPASLALLLLPLAAFCLLRPGRRSVQAA